MTCTTLIVPQLVPQPMAKPTFYAAVEEFVADTSAILNRARSIGMFRTRTANQVLREAAAQPEPKVLYPNLIVENELTICFADTGIGKSVFAVQIGAHIALTQKVLYVDLELSDKQFEKRYRDEHGCHFDFPDDFLRLDFKPSFTVPENVNYDEFFIDSLLGAISSTGAKVVIIDNMTKLAAGDTDTAKATIPIMEALTRIKLEHGITFLVLEHNKKVDCSRPISLNDLQGSKMKANFADAVFSIGRSQSDSSMRYIKQLKVRSIDCEYDTGNVLKCELQQAGGFLQLREIETVSEYEFLKQPNETERSEQIAQAAELKKMGYSNISIGKQLGVSEACVRKWLKQ
jgi:KaiC/GvpD/RAD55 family RecA-like ATPase